VNKKNHYVDKTGAKLYEAKINGYGGPYQGVHHPSVSTLKELTQTGIELTPPCKGSERATQRAS